MGPRNGTLSALQRSGKLFHFSLARGARGVQLMCNNEGIQGAGTIGSSIPVPVPPPNSVTPPSRSRLPHIGILNFHSLSNSRSLSNSKVFGNSKVGGHSASYAFSLLPAPSISPTSCRGITRVGASNALFRHASTHHIHQAVAEEEEGFRYLTKVRTGENGKHTFFSDLAYGEGEGDTAPAPMEYAISSVALCTTMTVRLYAERKGWPLKRIRVEAIEQRTKGAGHIPDGFSLTLHFEGDLSNEQRERLYEIAGKCPVKQVMMGKMPHGITTTLAQ